MARTVTLGGQGLGAGAASAGGLGGGTVSPTTGRSRLARGARNRIGLGVHGDVFYLWLLLALELAATAALRRWSRNHHGG